MPSSERIRAIVAQSVSIALALVPLAVALGLMRQFPQAVLALDAPTSEPWRLDPLALVGCSILALGTLRPRPLRVGVYITIAVLCAMVALVAADPIVQLLALMLVLCVVAANGASLGWFVIFVLFCAMYIGGFSAVIPPSLVLPLTICVAVAGSGALSWRGRNEVEAVVAPFWTLWVVRSLALEPWPTAAVVGATGVASFLLVILAWRILRSDSIVARDHTLATLLLMALIAAAQNTILGTVAALWVLVMYGVLVAAGDRHRAAPLGIVVLAVGVAAWWSVGAVAAANGFLGVGAIALVAVVAPLRALAVGRARRSWIVSGALLLALVVAMPWLTTTLALPITEQLGAGLTAPGLLDAWAWLGLSAMDAGHRRVTLLPAAVLLCLFVVAWAVVWLVGRLRGFAPPSPVVPRADAHTIERIRARVWWLR